MLDWKLGYSDGLDEEPAEKIDIMPYMSSPDTPGEAQLLWHKAGRLPDYNYGSNVLEYRWCEDVWWHYETMLTVEDRPGFEPFVTFDCIDYRYTIRVDGNIAADGEGMFTPVRVPLSAYAGKTVKLECIIHPVPKVKGVPATRDQARESVKPPVSYGWDWHPRLVPSGISGSVRLEYLPKIRIDSCEITYELSDDLETAELCVSAETVGSAHTIVAFITDANGDTVASDAVRAVTGRNELKLTLKSPKLWWPARQGEQYLYTVHTELFSENGDLASECSKELGLRRVRLVMNADGWEKGFPKSQGEYPFTLEINGRKIFCKGSNFVSPDIFYSLNTPERYRQLVTLALDANMNIFRMWGGSPVNKPEFFELCDKLGMMVWQEFPLACNNYPDKDAYLTVLEKEATSIVKRLREHPSVILWCGGNELFNSWSGMTNQSLALRILDRVTLTYDRKTPFIMTSPIYGVAHGPYVNIVDDSTGMEAITLMTASDHTAYTEFGCPGPAQYDYIRKYISDEDLGTFFELQTFDPDGKTHAGLANLDEKLTNPWFLHHAIKAHYPYDTWFRVNEIYRYFHKTDSLEECCELGQIIQGACYKVMFGQARIKWPRTSMAVNWDFNEPWPCFAGNSLIAYPEVVKPAYFDVKQALRDRMLALDLNRLRFAPGEEAEVGIYALNDLPDALSGGDFEITLDFDDADETHTELMRGSFSEIPGTSSVKIGTLKFKVPEDVSKTFRLTITCSDGELSESYTLFRKDGK
ncbi:MAG: glycoside hydrolase family 2 protein [Candidatus Flemingiibacterium sp.]